MENYLTPNFHGFSDLRMNDYAQEIADKILTAYQQKQPLKITSGKTKQFYGRKINAEILNVKNHSGVVEYEPSELYITARSGTPLSEIERIIDHKNQILPFEPPRFGASATIGGTVACGLSGPRRAYSGSLSDCILGADVINGKGEQLHFGGRVMKNVAGYDVSRLMCGALGTLGVITSITLRLLPKPENEQTITFETSCTEAIEKMNQWANTPLPISATFHDMNTLYVRLSGSPSTIKSSAKEMQGEFIEKNETFWETVKKHKHPFFDTELPLWRISVPPSTPELNIQGECLMEWSGALRWYATDSDERAIRTEVERVGGQATLFKGNSTQNIFHPLSKASMKFHKHLKQVMDPGYILNPGKMFAEL